MMHTVSQVKTSLNNPLIRFITERKYRWLRHTMFVVMGLILAFKGDIGSSAAFLTPQQQRAVLLTDSISLVIILAMLYLLLLVLVPRFLFRSKMLLFALFFFLIIVVIYLSVWMLDHHFLRPQQVPNMLHIELSIIHFVQLGAVASVLMGAVVGLKVFKNWIVDLERMNELQQVNLRTELEQLKSQVNPHFLFNTLNSLLVLMRTDTRKASEVLIGLSDLLRYQLYDSARDKIILEKDIAFIQNLLSLEKVRKDDFTFTIHTEGPVDGQLLPPFLFIPFVENAIKHGASTVGHSYLTLHFRVVEGHLHFSAENSKPAVKAKMIGGIGLGNIKRRLELLYPGTHTLEITDEPARYIVHLKIPL